MISNITDGMMVKSMIVKSMMLKHRVTPLS